MWIKEMDRLLTSSFLQAAREDILFPIRRLRKKSPTGWFLRSQTHGFKVFLWDQPWVLLFYSFTGSAKV